MNRLALFGEIARGFIDSDRLKLILFASGAESTERFDLTQHVLGFSAIAIFVLAYAFVMAE